MNWPYKPGFAAKALKLAAFTILLLSSAPAGAQTALAGAKQQAIDLYKAGRALSAIALLEKTLKLHSPKDSEYRDSYSLLLELCEFIIHIRCIQNHALPFSKLPTEASADKAAAAESLYYLAWGAAYGSPEERKGFRGLIDKGALITFDPIRNPHLYIKGQLLAARFYFDEHELSKARDCVDRAWARLLSMKDPGAFYLAHWIDQTINMLLATGDTVRAWGIYAVAAPFVNAALPAEGPNYARFKFTEVQLAQFLVDPQAGIAAIKEFLERMKQLELPSEIQDFHVGQALLTQVVYCAWGNDTECALRAIEQHPMTISQAKLIANGRFVGVHQLTYAAASTLAYTFAHRQVPADWAEAFSHRVEGINDVHTQELDGYRAFAQGLIMIRQDVERARPFFIEGGRSRVAAFQKSLALIDDSFPMLSTLDRILIQMAIRAIATKRGHGEEDFAFALSLFEMANRSLRQSDSDALAALAAAPSTDVRRQIHSRMRLYARQQTSERRLLQELIARSWQPAGSESSKEHKDEFAIYDHLAQYGEMRSRISRAVVKRTDGNPGRSTLPDFRRLQRALGPDEVLLSVVGLGNGIGALCVRRERAWISVVDVDVQMLARDMKILHGTFTDDRGLSDELDSQYPVDEALRIYQVLIKPSVACLQEGDHVIWVPDADLLALPMAALLSERPAQYKTGFDLSGAAWLNTRYAFSYLPSIRGFLAARRLSSTRAPERTFLGIGDPVLSGETVDGRSRAEAVLRGSKKTRGGLLTKLEELPEAGEELAAIRGVMGPDSLLLIREHATEAKFRRQPLDRYGVIEFATHGLVREEVPGLTEAALVLTPQKESDPGDDGLLTASEIANLNLSARLVVLSACNSANFDLGLFGNEVQGLSTAFALAGVSTVLATLWPVETNTSRDVMIEVFRKLKTGESPARALQLAIKNFVAQPPSRALAHPRFWAPFAVYGDGNVRLQGTAPPKPALIQYEVRNNRDGGEASSIVPSEDGKAFYVNGTEDMVAGRYHSFIRKYSSEGTELWSYRDPRVGGSHGLVLTGNAVVVGGYLSQEEGRTVPVVTAISSAGKLLWRRNVEVGDRDGTALSVSPDGQGNVAVLTAVRRRGKGFQPVSMIVSVLSPSGEQVRSTELSIGEQEWLPAGRIFLTAGRLFIAVREPGLMQSGRVVRNSYGLVQICTVRQLLTVITLDPSSLETTGKRTYPNLEAWTFEELDSTTLLVAATVHDECDYHQRFAVLLTLGADDGVLSPFYHVDEPSNSIGTSVTTTAEGRIYFAVASTRTLDSVARRTADIEHFDFERARIDSEQREVTEIQLIELDRQGKRVATTWIQAGASIYIAGMRHMRGVLRVVGSSGGEVMQAAFH